VTAPVTSSDEGDRRRHATDIDGMRSLAIDLACWAAGRIATAPVAGVRTKANAADPVTDTDTDVEREVRARIATAFPSHRIVGEEFGDSGPADSEYVWFCDPVDGTTNYANGIAWCSFSLCCKDSRGGLVGVVADPFRRLLAVGVRGGGAVAMALDEEFVPATGTQRDLRVRPAEVLAGTVVMTEYLANVPWPGMDATIAGLVAADCTMRITGSSALALLQVGLGAAVGCIIGRYSAIDNAAAILIGSEAGAVVSGMDGAPDEAPDGGVLLASPGVQPAILDVWRRAVAWGDGH
jgi:fructose-1,6-bisphosphatase/inositol monophosphatase family enzyme